MKRYLILMLICVVITPSAIAQDDPETNVEVVHHLTIPPPLGYTSRSSGIQWSPDSSMFILTFTAAADGNSLENAVQQMVDVESGEILFEFDGGFIIWYADSSHILARENPDAPTYILDARTGAIAAGLADSGATFDRHPIQDTIINLDDSNTLRIYDSATATLLLTLENVEDLPFYSPDRSRFAVNIINQGIQIYNTTTYSLEYALDGFQAELLDHRFYYSTETVWSPDGTMLIVLSLDSPHEWLGPRHIWTVGRGISQPIYNLTDDVVWSPDGTQIAGGSDLTKVRIYDSTTGELLETLPDIPDTPISVDWWTEYGILIKSGSYRTGPVYLSLWNPDQQAFLFQDGVGLEIHYVQDNRLISIAFGYAVRIFDIETGQLQREGLIRGPHWHSPNLRWMAERDWGTVDTIDGLPRIYVSHLETMELVADIEMESDFIPEIAWSPDSQYFAAIGDPTTTIWKITETPN